MSNISNEKVFDRAIDLIVHADQMLQSWTSRYIAIEGALAFAAATLIKWRADTPELQKSGYLLLFIMAEVLIVVLGIVAAWLITKMVEYELEWQRNYVLAAKRAEGDNAVLYPFEVKQGTSRTLNLFRWSSIILTVMWLGISATIVVLPAI